MRRFVIIAALGLLTLVLGAGPASAHAALVGSTPGDGARLSAAPTTIELTFNENVGRAAIIVTAPDGTALDVGDVTTVDRTASATVEDAGKKGRYAASFRVVSADGHPVEGTITYTVTTGTTVEQTNLASSTGQDGFVHRHGSHLVWGGVAGLAAVALIVAPMRGRRDADEA